MNKSTILIIFSGFLFLNCSNMLNPFKKLEGTWTAAGDNGDGHSWYLEYTFKGDSYSMKGYPPIYETGKMKLLVQNGDSMLVQFMVQKSDPEYKSHDNWVVINGDRININSMEFAKSGGEEKK